MNTTFSRVIRFGLVATVGLSLLIPFAGEAATVKKVVKKKTYRMSISAIPGKDEKNFENPTSRCTTATMKSLFANAMSQMKKDVAKSGSGHDSANETYKVKLETVWSAMEEPYCGYGSLGMTAVKKSFLKSIDRTRAEYLASVK